LGARLRRAVRTQQRRAEVTGESLGFHALLHSRTHSRPSRQAH
jgi:hypothetical protein